MNKGPAKRTAMEAQIRTRESSWRLTVDEVEVASSYGDSENIAAHPTSEGRSLT